MDDWIPYVPYAARSRVLAHYTRRTGVEYEYLMEGGRYVIRRTYYLKSGKKIKSVQDEIGRYLSRLKTEELWKRIITGNLE